MPSSSSLSGLPVIGVGVTSTSMRPDDVGSSTATTIPTVGTSLVWSHRGSQQSAIGLTRIQGVYVGAGNSPVSAKLAEKICRWDFVDMADMLPEVRLGDREGEPEKLLPRRPRCVTDIWSWLHCYGTYVSVLGPSFPEAIPELMGYMSLIIRCSQDYEGLAWVWYDMAYRRQAAASGNRKWSEVNGTLYSVCFTGKFRGNRQCDLCLARTHKTNNCPLYGESIDGNPLSAEVYRRQHERLPQSAGPSGSTGWRQLPPSGEVCRLWNENLCRFSRCRHTHVCLRCGGSHPVVECPLQ